MTELTYEAALGHEDKAGVIAVNAQRAEQLDRISEFPNLRSLDLSGNRHVTDFAFLEHLSALEELLLCDMGLTAIPPEVETLGNLSKLFLGKNTITDLSRLKQLPALVDLGLEEMNLRKIPNEVLAISGLKILGLYGNGIGSLTAVKKLPGLEELYVAGNKLKKLPKELRELGRLRKLAMAENYELTDWSVLETLEQLEELSMTNAHAMDRIPDGIFALPNLRSLTIKIHWNAPPDDLPGMSAIDKLEQLEELEIHGASFEKLPAAMHGLKKLKKLDLSDNEKLADISALEELPALQELDLSECAIEIVPESFSSLVALQELDLSHNKPLAQIPGLGHLPALEKLTLFSNLPELPDSLGTMTSLKVLKLSAQASDVGFLANLENLEELYIANCSFDSLPPQLRKLQKLTVYQQDNAGDDAYLEAYTSLEELSVTQASFTLPPLPRLEKLSVGKITGALELSQLAAAPTLRELVLHRSESIERLPEEIALAKGLEALEVSFVNAMQDISALRDLPALKRLKINDCPQLTVLPPQLASLTGLETLTLSDVGTIEDLSIIGELPNLVELELREIKGLRALPASFAALAKLRRISLKRLDDLKDIDVLERMPGLKKLSCDDCDAMPRKELARIENAIAAHGEGEAALAMSYEQFIETALYETHIGKEDASRTYSFPLWFERPDTLREAMQGFSWLDDFMDDDESELGAILNDPDSALKPLALLDFGYEGCDTSNIDAYSEEIFLVDTANARNPVLIWGHDGAPTQLHDSFDSFIANLRDFRQASEDEAPDAQSNRTYLECIDEKSSKFWQIIVDGASHEVTYGKIGTQGTSKRKEFADAAAADKDAARLIKSKLKKGYTEKA